MLLVLEDVLNKHRNLFPDESDFEGAIDAIFRVQEIFQVKSLDLAKDNIPSETRGFPMMTNDAFEIGKTAYESEKYEESQKWLETAVTLWKEGLHTKKDNMAEILDYLSYVEYKVEIIQIKLKSPKIVLS